MPIHPKGKRREISSLTKKENKPFSFLQAIGIILFLLVAFRFNQTLGIIFIVLFLITFLIQKTIPNAQTWYIISMLRFTKPRKIFDAFSHHPKLVNTLTDIGLVVGFGAIAIDYLWMQKRKKWERIIAFAISAIILGSGVGYVFPLSNPIIPIPELIARAGFGIFGMAGLILISLVFSALDIFAKLSTGKNACAGVAPVIPGVSLPNSPITVPLHAWISFLIILIVHEASHGFVIRKLGITLKSYGLLLLGILPIGAFVEPEEKELKKLEKRNPRDALRMYSAGPSSNLYFFIIGTILAILFASLIFTPFISPKLDQLHRASVNGIIIEKVEEKIVICGSEFEAPAHNVLFAGDKIIAANGVNVHTLQDYAKEVIGEKDFNVMVLRNTENFTYSFAPNELGRIGVNLREIPNENFSPPWWYEPFLQIGGFIAGFFGWLLLLNLLVAMANFIPVDPFDGGKMVKLLLFPYLGMLKLSEEDTKKLIARVFLLILLILIVINAAPLVILNPVA